MALRERYDSNPINRGPGQKVPGNFITELNPRADLNGKFEKFRLNGSYMLNARFYNEDPKLNYTSHFLSATANADATENTTLALTHTFTYTRDSSEVPQINVLLKRSEIFSNVSTLEATHYFTQRTSGILTLTHGSLNFTEPSFIDTRTDTASLALSHMLTPSTSFRGSYSYTLVTYEAQPSTIYIVSHSALLGVTNHPAQGLTLGISGGATLNPKNNSYDWLGIAEAMKEFQASNVHFTYTRSVSSTSGIVTELMVNDEFFLGWSHTINDSVKVSASGDLIKSRSKPSKMLDTTSYDAGASVTWQYSKNTSFETGYFRRERWTKNSLLDAVVRDQVYIGVTYTPEGWRL